MRSRAVILPHPCDPFLLNYWLTNFYRYWIDEIDKLYIYANSPILNNPEVYEYYLYRTKHFKIELITEKQQVEHGTAINKTLDYVKEDHIMLVEDDAFIFKKGIVDECFGYVEQGITDIVGSKRGSCGHEILQRAKELWSINYEGEGDQGCNFWPNFFFTRKEILTNTDRNFCSRLWKAGELVEPLNYTCLTDQAGDTFVNTSLQLRQRGYKIIYKPQYHGHPQDLEHFMDNKFLFDGNAYWTHIGSLSSGISGVLKDPYGRPLIKYFEPIDEDMKKECILDTTFCQTEMEHLEWERRIQWFLTFYQQRPKDALPELADLYIEAIDRVIDQYGLNRKRIRRSQRAYATLGL